MTEEEWLACEDPKWLLAFVAGKTSDRRILLFGIGCLRAHEAESSQTAQRCMAAEHYADGLATIQEVHAAWGVPPPSGQNDPEQPWAMASRWVHKEYTSPSRIQVATFLRDIFGNPFRSVSFDSEWRSSTAVALAKGMYESRDFGAMPILADALQDAGCGNDDVLNHCRDANGVHVRGCWVVDFVLGKS